MSTYGERAANADISRTLNECKSVKNENIAVYFGRTLKACDSGCKRATLQKNMVPAVFEANLEKCRLRCAQAYDASLGEAIAYQSGRNEALGECATTAAATNSAASKVAQ